MKTASGNAGGACPPKTIVIRLEDGSRIECERGIAAGALLRGPHNRDGVPFIGCLVNNDLSSLSFPLDFNCQVQFVTMADRHGMRIYRSSLSFLLAKAVAELFPGVRFSIEHSFGSGRFCSFERGEREGIARRQIARIEACMRELVARDLRIERRKIPFTEAVAMFESAGQRDKANLLRFRNPPRVVTYCCGGFSDIAYGPLCAATGVLKHFRLIHYPPGLVLQFPEPDQPQRVAPFRDQPHLFQIFREHKEWGRILGVHDVGKLNELIVDGGIREFIRIEEAFHEKKIATIADRIADRRRQVKVILISGPSASGKTTFSKRLAVQLQVNGIRPVTLSLDNYYVDDENTPRGPDGRPNYEHIDAVDLRLFNRHILSLIAGREIQLPHFNFEKKRREFRGARLRIAPDQMIIVEGIHGLNPGFLRRIAPRRKFRIYISALTQLNLDANNRISTTDNRLIRRLVRDHTYRGNSALTTLRMWPAVRRGEKTWIFPYQQLADATFNSALDYELAALKPLIEPLLMEIKPADQEYAEARRLEAFLTNFLEVSKNEVPHTSILREFIGASSFQY